MAKLKGPLFSVSAHGKLGRALSYSQRKGQALTRKYSYPKRAASLSQLTQRTIIGMLNAQWAAMSAADKDTWEATRASAGAKMSAYNFFIKTAQTDLYTHSGLIAFYPFNESTGGTIYDASGNGLDGTLYPSYPTNCPQRLSSSINYKFGNDIVFDGIDDYAKVPHNNKMNITDKLSIALWCRPQNTGTSNILITKEYNAKPFWGLYINASGEFMTTIANATNEYYYSSGALIKGWDTWYFHVITFDGTTKKSYHDGVYRNSTTTAINISATNNTNDIKIADAVGMRLYGRLNNIMLFNRVLSPVEIGKLYLLNREIKRRQAQLA